MVRGGLQGKAFGELPYYFPDGSVFGLVILDHTLLDLHLGQVSPVPNLHNLSLPRGCTTLSPSLCCRFCLRQFCTLRSRLFMSDSCLQPVCSCLHRLCTSRPTFSRILQRQFVSSTVYTPSAHPLHTFCTPSAHLHTSMQRHASACCCR